MNLSDLSRQQLVELIQKASAELADRLAQPEVERIKHPRQVIAMREPSEDDKDFVLMIKAELQRGGYIQAHERGRIAEIAEDFPEWVRLQQVPTSSSAGEWRKAKQRHSAPRAKER